MDRPISAGEPKVRGGFRGRRSSNHGPVQISQVSNDLQNSYLPNYSTNSSSGVSGTTARGRGGNRRIGRGRTSASTQRERSDRMFDDGTDSHRRVRSGSTASASHDDHSSNRSSGPYIGYKMLSEALKKTDDELILHIDGSVFKLDEYLSDERMKEKLEWVQMLTTILERILGALGQEHRIAKILMKLPRTTYFEALYQAIRKLDPQTKEFQFDLILKTLKIIEQIITVSPQSEELITPFTERIGGYIPNFPPENETVVLIKEIHKNVTQRAQHIFQQKQMKSDEKSAEVDDRPPPDNFRLLDIVPSMIDILSTEPVFLRKNLVDQGASYTDAEHYLDVHFRLLREDFLSPLRDGIQLYRSKSHEKNSDVRIYENVYSLGPKINPKTGMLFGLQLDRERFGRIQWKNSRRLIYGSLVALTTDCFETCTIMTVEDRQGLEKDLTFYVRPYIPTSDIHIDGNLTKFDQLLTSRNLTMVETTSYFEAYRHILRALQKIPSNEFPLAPYILKLSSDISPPNYIKPTTKFDFTPLLVPLDTKVSAATKSIQREPTVRGKTSEVSLSLQFDRKIEIDPKYRNVCVMDPTSWPTADALHLNSKQYEALLLTLTKKVALIQGPPGTGKTFLGVKIAELLLHNRSVWCPPDQPNSPILMVCQTNHALDQFLEHIIRRLNLKEGVIRVGGRCKNETIQPFSLSTLRQYYRENKLIPSSLHAQKREIMNRKIYNENRILAKEKIVDLTYSNLTSIDNFRQENIIESRQYNSLILGADEAGDATKALNEWLGLRKRTSQMNLTDGDFSLIDFVDQGTDADQRVQSDDEDEEREEEERRRNDFDEDDDEEFSRHSSRSAINSAPKTINDDDQEDNDEDEDGWQTAVDKKTQRKIMYELLNKPPTVSDEQVKTLMDEKGGKLWSLDLPSRHELYRYWLEKYRKTCHDSVENARAQFNKAIDEHRLYLQQEDYFCLQKAIIIAMTTTGAARYFEVLQKLGCKIVIVEEAAEIFEAHIVTSLSSKCEHLILIGDHVQLRPNPSVYKLAATYKIDVSLFERLVKNQFPNVRLNIQHRMHPEICQLMNHFYDDLQNHRTVQTERPAIIGVEQNLYFIRHRHPEEQVTEGNSKQNRFEAEYVVALAHYLIKQGYKPSDITILVMYLGQRALISRLIKQHSFQKTLQGLRVNVTDSYQGEENEIILLSLVRSENPANSIGFLKIHNRICVALSRARCAMFIVGNLDFLMKNEDMWKKIGLTLAKNQAVGEGLKLCCAQHPEDQAIIAKTAADFQERPEGGCKKLCGARLPCGHPCQNFCHNYSHERVICKKPCLEVRPDCGHLCRSQCHFNEPNKHGVCREMVEKTVLPCNHTIRLACHVEPSSETCTQSVPVLLPCGHRNQVKCTVRNSNDLTNVKCQQRCEAILSCSHKCSGSCSTCQAGRLHIRCRTKCTRELLCSHPLETTCADSFSSCASPCETFCSHSRCTQKCGQPCIPCREPCDNFCEHDQCTKVCSEPCDRNRCNCRCVKTLSCGHSCIGLCGEPCPPQCRICHRQVVEEIFYGNEDHSNARFVLLPDCGHIFESTKLDEEIDRFFNHLKESRSSIRFPSCPRNDCQKVIRHCQRYRSILNQIQLWIEKVQYQQQKQLNSQEILGKRNSLIQKIQEIYTDMNLKIRTVDFTLNKIVQQRNSANIDEVNFLENTQSFLQTISDMLMMMLVINLPREMVEPPVVVLLTYMFDQSGNHSITNYTHQQLIDIQNELQRIRCLINYYSIDYFLREGNEKHHYANELNDMKNLVDKLEAFSAQDKRRFDGIQKNFQLDPTLVTNFLIPEPTFRPTETINMDTAHWFVCSHDQVYSIDRESGKIENTACALCGLKKRFQSRASQSHRSIYTYNTTS